jgi:hypothetical protein
LREELKSIEVAPGLSMWDAYVNAYAVYGPTLQAEYLNQELVGRLAEHYYADMGRGVDGRPERKRSYGAKIDALLDRIAEFLVAVRNALNKIGITQVDQLFAPAARRADLASELRAFETLDKARSGEIASRGDGVRREPTLEVPKYDPAKFFPNTPTPDQVHLSSEEGQEARGLFPALQGESGTLAAFSDFNPLRAIRDRIWALYAGWRFPNERSISSVTAKDLKSEVGVQSADALSAEAVGLNARLREAVKLQNDILSAVFDHSDAMTVFRRERNWDHRKPETIVDAIFNYYGGPVDSSLAQLAVQLDRANLAREGIERQIRAEVESARRGGRLSPRAIAELDEKLGTETARPETKKEANDNLQARIDAQFEAMDQERRRPRLRVIEGGLSDEGGDPPVTLAAFASAPEPRPVSLNIPGLEASVTEKVKEGGERMRTYAVGPLAEETAGGQDAVMSEDGLARVRSLGFDTSNMMYHATKGGKFATPDLGRAGASDPGLVGRAVYLTPSVSQAEYFDK